MFLKYTDIKRIEKVFSNFRSPLYYFILSFLIIRILYLISSSFTLYYVGTMQKWILFLLFL